MRHLSARRTHVRNELNRSRRVSGFHTPTALDEMLTRDLDAEIADLAAIPQNLRLRPYQVEANTAIEQAIGDRKRKMLVAMATGTGKTFTMVNEVYRLMKSGVARRVLFLVDRRALAAQAVRAFASFEAEPGLKFDKIYEVYWQRFQKGDFDEGEKFDPNVLPNSLLTNPKLGDAFVYVCTIQRMTINLFGGEGALTIGDEADRRRRRAARHPDPRLRPDHRRRVPPRLLGQGHVGLAQHARPLRRHQDRPHRHAGGPHHGLLRERGLPLRVRAGRPRGLPRRLRRRARSAPTSA